jgi:hypothetical protein
MYTETQLTEYLNRIRDIKTISEKNRHRYRYCEATFTHLFSSLIMGNSELNMSCFPQGSSIRTNYRPDFSIFSDDKLIGFIECKKTSINLDSEDCQNQVQKYSKEYDNVILTNFIEFRLYQNSRKVGTMLFDNLDKAGSENVKHFNNLISSFFKYGSLLNKRPNKNTDWEGNNINNYGFAFPIWELLSLLIGFFVPSIIKNIIFILFYRRSESNPYLLEIIEIITLVLIIGVIYWKFKNSKIFQQKIWIAIGTLLAVFITFLSIKVVGFPYILLSPAFHKHVGSDIKNVLLIGVCVIFILASLIVYSKFKKHDE